MGGFHILDLVIIAIIGLALFGPKALQSIARNAGKSVGQAKSAKEKVMAELPMEELSKVAQKVPMNPQQAIQMLITPEKEKEQD
jgi:sec-independent protein translocase protein TatA